MSSVIVRASRQDSETRYKAVDRPYTRGSAPRAFAERLQAMLGSHAEFQAQTGPNVTCQVYNEDIRTTTAVRDASANLVVTSPPYANSYDYYLYHKQRMNWLGLDFRIAKEGEIGSRLEFSSQRAPFERFLLDMTAGFETVVRSLVPGGRCIVIQGDSRVGGVMYSGQETIGQVAKRVGLKFIEVASTLQADTSKAFNPSFAVKGKREHVIVLEKPRGSRQRQPAA